MDEEWKTWGNGNYEISDHGRIRRAKPGHCTFVGRIKIPQKVITGYLITRINDQAGKLRTEYVHHVVASLFIGPRPSGCVINHVDGDKTNNHITNIEYVTRLENAAHAKVMNLVPVGERNGRSKLTNDQVRSMRVDRKAGKPVWEIALDHGIARVTARAIVNGRAWKHVS